MGNALNKITKKENNINLKPRLRKNTNQDSNQSVSQTKRGSKTHGVAETGRQQRRKKIAVKTKRSKIFHYSEETSPSSGSREIEIRNKKRIVKVSAPKGEKSEGKNTEKKSTSDHWKITKAIRKSNNASENEKKSQTCVSKSKKNSSSKGKHVKTRGGSPSLTSKRKDHLGEESLAVSQTQGRKQNRRKKNPLPSPDGCRSAVTDIATVPSASSPGTVDQEPDSAETSPSKNIISRSSSGSKMTSSNERAIAIDKIDIGHARNIMLMVDEWKKEEEKLQKDYDDAHQQIQSSLREENQAKAQAQTWRTRLERLAVAHRERLFRQATLLRSRLCSAEHRLRSTEKTAKGLVATNSKLKGMIDVVKEEARSLRIESEKKRESARRELNEKLISVEGELRKLKERITSSGIPENGCTKSEEGNVCTTSRQSRNLEDEDNYGNHRGKSTSALRRHIARPHGSSAKQEDHSQMESPATRRITQPPLPIPPTVITTPKFTAYELPPVHSGPYPAPYSRYVPFPYVSHPNFSNSYTMPHPTRVFMSPSVQRYQENNFRVSHETCCSHSLPCSTKRTHMPDHNCLSTSTVRYQRLPAIAQEVHSPIMVDTCPQYPPSHMSRRLICKTNAVSPTWCDHGRGPGGENNKTTKRTPSMTASRAKRSSIEELRACGQGNHQALQCSGESTIRSGKQTKCGSPVGENGYLTAYESSNACDTSGHGERDDRQKLVVLEREVYNAFARSRDRKFTHEVERAQHENPYVFTQSHRDGRKPPKPVWLQDEQIEKKPTRLAKGQLDSDNEMERRMPTVQRSRARGDSVESQLSIDPTSPLGAESAPTPCNDRGYFGDFERSTSSLEIAKRRRIIIRNRAAASRRHYS